MRAGLIHNQLLYAQKLTIKRIADEPDNKLPHVFILSENKLQNYLQIAEQLGIDLQPDTSISKDMMVYVTVEELRRRESEQSGAKFIENAAIDESKLWYDKYKNNQSITVVYIDDVRVRHDHRYLIDKLEKTYELEEFDAYINGKFIRK